MTLICFHIILAAWAAVKADKWAVKSPLILAYGSRALIFGWLSATWVVKLKLINQRQRSRYKVWFTVIVDCSNSNLKAQSVAISNEALKPSKIKTYLKTKQLLSLESHFQWKHDGLQLQITVLIYFAHFFLFSPFFNKCFFLT